MSGFWALAINVSDRGFQIVKLIVLANILSPGDFGLMGISLLVLAALRQFTRLGFDTALIQRKEERVDDYFDTMWVLKIGRATTIALALFFSAPAAASFFGEPRATALIRVIAFSPLLLSLQNPAVVYLQKNLEFHRQFAYQVSGSLLDVVVAFAVAVTYQTVWALVIGLLVGQLTRALSSYVLHPYRPSLQFDVAAAKELFGYGKWITLSGAVLFLVTQGDDALVGWALGATALGLYQVAYRFSNAPATEITHVISSVVFPTYSKLQDDAARLRDGYGRAVRVTTLVSVPASVGILFVVPDFVTAFLGTEWHPTVPLMRLLAVFGLIRSIGAIDGPLLDALGRPDYGTKFQTLHLVLLAVIIYPAIEGYGLVGAATAVSLSIVVPVALQNYVARKTIEFNLGSYAGILGLPAVASGIMAGGVLAIQQLFVSSPLLSFLVASVSGAVLYAVSVLALDWLFGIGLLNRLRSLGHAV